MFAPDRTSGRLSDGQTVAKKINRTRSFWLYLDTGLLGVIVAEIDIMFHDVKG
jgi:hypothetical protein